MLSLACITVFSFPGPLHSGFFAPSCFRDVSRDMFPFCFSYFSSSSCPCFPLSSNVHRYFSCSFTLKNTVIIVWCGEIYRFYWCFYFFFNPKFFQNCIKIAFFRFHIASFPESILIYNSFSWFPSFWDLFQTVSSDFWLYMLCKTTGPWNSRQKYLTNSIYFHKSNLLT